MHEDLGRPVSENLLKTEQRAVFFVDDQRFISALSKECLRYSVSDCASQYQNEVWNCFNYLKLPFQAWMKVLASREGTPSALVQKQMRTLGHYWKFQVLQMNEAKHRKLSKAPVHSLNDERLVGFISYEIHIREKQCLESASNKEDNKQEYASIGKSRAKTDQKTL